MTTAAERRHMDRVARMRCVVCVRHGVVHDGMPVTLHHVAEGSGLRSDFAVAPMCFEHHQGKAGLHGMGPKAFIRLYRPPGDSEYGLLVWLIEDMSK